MKAKAVFSVVASAATLTLVLVIFLPQMVLPFALKQARHFLPGATFSVQRIGWSGFCSLKIENATFGYTQDSRPFPVINFAGKNSSSPLLFWLRRVEVDRLKIDVQAKDLRISGECSFDYDFRRGQWRSLKADLPAIRFGSGEADGLKVEAQADAAGTVVVDELRIGKLKMRNLRGSLRFTKDWFYLNPVSAGLLDGRLSATLRFGLNPGLRYSARVLLTDLPVSAVMKNFEWDKKCSASGLLSGDLQIEGRAGAVTRLDGRLVAAPPGGDIVILDPDFFQRIADSAKQPVEIVKASFEDYHYNTGIIGLSLIERNVRLDLQLDGEKGKRDLEVTLHDML